MDWTADPDDRRRHAPETTVITTLTGDGEAELPGKGNQGKPKKQLVVNFATPLAEDGAMPGEIDRLPTALLAELSILRHFPNIVLAAHGHHQQRSQQVAQFSVVCLPKTELIKGGTAEVTTMPPAWYDREVHPR